MNISEKLKDIARWSIGYAMKKGCSAARTSIVIMDENSFEFRNDKLDKLQQSSENKLFIELFVDERYGSFSTNRIEKQELEHFIAEAISSIRFLSADTYRRLPDEDRYFKGKNEGLDLFDNSFNDITAKEKIELAQKTVDEIYRSDKRIISVSSYVNDGCSAEYMITSNGFEAESKDTAYSLGAEVSLKTNTDSRAESYWSESNIYWDKLKKDDIAKKAFERAIGKIGQQKIQSGKYNLLLDNLSASRLLSPVISAMYGISLQQKNSFLLDKLGKTIASSMLTLTDTPHLKSNFGARWFDGEGVATQNRTIIANGILNMYFIDTYNSLKMNMEPTISSPSIVTVRPGNNNFEGMLAEMSDGIWVTGFNGGNCNSTTGDFSFGVEGFLIEKGLISQPISEMNITGNMLDLWHKLSAIGNDPRPNTSWRVPSLMFTDVNFNGL